MNYFEHETVARKYAESRPYFHPLVMRRIRNFLGLREPVPAALDVACGTGQSSVALKEIAYRIVATDVSREMLTQAPHDGRIRYVEAPAEELPFADKSFDLLTAALAFHWFDRARFLAEARRVLRPFGWLIVYDNAFLGKMKENADYERWHRECYLARYPSPPRDRRPLTNEDACGHGFSLIRGEEYTNEVRFSVEELANYLTTQSNVVVAIERGIGSLQEIHGWLVDSLSPLFDVPTGTFRFGGAIWYLRKQRYEGVSANQGIVEGG
jgi:SAM-dependent methyltransferase